MLYESKSFRVENRDRVVTLWLDLRNHQSHSLTRLTLNELSLVVDRIATLPPPDVVLIRSSRPGVFLDDFAIEELASFTSPLEFAAVARRGQELADKVAHLKSPTVVVIEGQCRGAGLELALACDFRVAVDDSSTTFDHPAVARGLIPCWGGTVRLPRLIGIRVASRFLTSAQPISSVAAHKIGLVDRVFPTATLHADINGYIDRVRERPNRSSNWVRRITRSILDWPFVVRTQSKSAENEQVELNRTLVAGVSSPADGLAAERSAISRIAETKACQNMLSLHRHARESGRWFADPVNPISALPQRIGIVGGGERGVDLAIRLAKHGHDVAVQTLGRFDSAEFPRRLSRRLNSQIGTGELSPTSARTIEKRVCWTTEWTGFENTELVFEATTEDPGVKRNVLQELECRVRPRVILASCSTAVPLESVQAEMSRPSRAVGFCPPFHSNSNVVEIIASPWTSRESIAAISTWARCWNLIPVQVADRPGRLVGQIQLAYLSEAVRLVSEGLPIESIDHALRQFGMSRGPLEWCDEIGLDNIAEQTAHLQLAIGEEFNRNLLFERLLAHRIVGRATEEGFYRYGQRRRPNQLVRSILWSDLNASELAPYFFDERQALCEGVERVVLRTINETAIALPDEPDADPATVDMALALGMGWAPQRGGPLRYADSIGLASVVARLSYFAERYGRDYAPCDELIRRAEAGESFYGDRDNEMPVGQPAWRMVG